MSKIQTNLGYGKHAIVEMDTFTRIMAEQFWDDEEVRYDSPSDYRGGWSYVAVAPAGSSPLDPVWACIRRSYDSNGKKYRDQFRYNVAWTDRANGWL